jgi:hypothetical protein
MNVHRGGDAASTLRAVREVVLPLRRRLGVGGAFGLALRLGAAGVEELHAHPALRAQVAALFREHALVPFTGNAFVHGEFHGRPLKDEVYRPAWSEPERGVYTRAFARLLAEWNEPGAEVSLSTAPGSWRGWREGSEAEGERARRIAGCALALEHLEEETGVAVRLGLEPEPGCTIDTVAEACRWFAGPLAYALDRVSGGEAHVGVCFDACHQSVMHEDCAASLALLAERGVRVAKVQASCALEAPDPAVPATRAALAAFDEPVYLHQVAARERSGRLAFAPDLGHALSDPAWRERAPWRVHFHVPVFRREAAGGLRTTQPDLEATLAAYFRALPTPHLEIETYTWEVLPEAERRDGAGFDLVEALAREYEWVLAQAGRAGFDPEGA